MVFDSKGRVSRKWTQVRNKSLRASGRSKGLTGAALDAAVVALAAADPSLVKFESVGET